MGILSLFDEPDFWLHSPKIVVNMAPKWLFVQYLADSNAMSTWEAGVPPEWSRCVSALLAIFSFRWRRGYANLS